MTRKSFSSAQQLVDLHRLESEAEQQRTWLESMAALAALAEDDVATLEGLDPHALAKSARLALNQGWAKDLDTLPRERATLALYELGHAAASDEVKERLENMAFKRLLRLNAHEFSSVVARVARNEPQLLELPRIRARVALAIEMPCSYAPGADSLALLLTSQRALRETWLQQPSTGTLPARLLTARILERACYEAVRRARQGEQSAVELFDDPSVRSIWTRLLQDKEALVWSRVACARGALAEMKPEFIQEMKLELDLGGQPTEWRRAAASLAATLSFAGEAQLPQCEELLQSELCQRDPDVSAAMVTGLSRVVSLNSAIAEDLLEKLVAQGGLNTVEALVNLRRQRFDIELGARAVTRARDALQKAARPSGAEEDGRQAFMHCCEVELGKDGLSLPWLLLGALRDFAEEGSEKALSNVSHVLSETQQLLRKLEDSSWEDSSGRWETTLALWQLDVALLTSPCLHHLCLLDESGTLGAALSKLYGQFSSWLAHVERRAIEKQGAVPFLSLRLRRLRTWLHFVDADGMTERAPSSRQRERQALNATRLLARARDDAHSPLRRTVCAAAARACDALLRTGTCATSDIVLTVARTVEHPTDLLAFAEASMMPELQSCYEVLAQLARSALRKETGAPERGADTLRELGQQLPHGESSRVEALRLSIRHLCRAIENVQRAQGLDLLTDPEAVSPLTLMAQAHQQLAQLCAGAELRVGVSPPRLEIRSGALTEELERALHEVRGGQRDRRAEAIEKLERALEAEVPFSIARYCGQTLHRILSYPVTAPDTVRQRARVEVNFREDRPLPSWLPPGRILGGYYVLRTLGAGSGGSVFAARRQEEREHASAPTFALKVPEYDGSTARALGESEFLQMFREEAGALLALPSHANLASLVTFDAGVRPKPILVMEYVEGPSLAHLIDSARMNTVSALAYLLGVAAGLSVMHSRGLGHLDVKPSNIILRASREESTRFTPVLVDFGLAGSKIRPGCATSPYGAPEIWVDAEERLSDRPQPADVYAFCCLAYETLTGRMLVDGSTDYAVINAHLRHDGEPPRLRELKRSAPLRPLAELLTQGLRKDPTQRVRIGELASGLRRLAPLLTSTGWPLAASAAKPAPSVRTVFTSQLTT